MESETGRERDFVGEQENKMSREEGEATGAHNDYIHRRRVRQERHTRATALQG